MVSARRTLASVSHHGKLVTAYNKFLGRIPVESDEEGSHSDGLIHPSAIGGCLTNAVYTALGFPYGGLIDVKAVRIFALGHAIHRLLQHDLHCAGLLDVDEKGKPRVEVPFFVKEYALTGHIDGVLSSKLYGTRKVLEIKSITSNSLASLKEPKEGHKIQAGCYVFACKHTPGFEDVDGVVFLYYGKNDSELVEFPFAVSPGLLSLVEQRITEMKALLVEARKFTALPKPRYEDPATAPCKWCQWKSVCHATFERQAYADKVLPLMPALLAAKEKKRADKQEKARNPVRLPPPRRAVR